MVAENEVLVSQFKCRESGKSESQPNAQYWAISASGLAHEEVAEPRQPPTLPIIHLSGKKLKDK